MAPFTQIFQSMLLLPFHLQVHLQVCYCLQSPSEERGIKSDMMQRQSAQRRGMICIIPEVFFTASISEH